MKNDDKSDDDNDKTGKASNDSGISDHKQDYLLPENKEKLLMSDTDEDDVSQTNNDIKSMKTKEMG